MSTKAPKKSSVLITILLAFLTAAVILAVLAAVVFHVKPRWLPKLPLLSQVTLAPLLSQVTLAPLATATGSVAR